MSGIESILTELDNIGYGSWRKVLSRHIDNLTEEKEKLSEELNISEKRAFALMFLVNGDTTLETVRKVFEDVLSIFRIHYEQTFDYQINPIIGSVFISAKTEESAKELFYKKIENARNIKFQSIERVGYASKQFREEGIL